MLELGVRRLVLSRRAPPREMFTSSTSGPEPKCTVFSPGTAFGGNLKVLRRSLPLLSLRPDPLEGELTISKLFPQSGPACT